MKKHITVEQVRELNSKKLDEIGVLSGFFSWGKVSEVLTISKMIEIVSERYKVVIQQDWNNDYDWWVVNIRTEYIKYMQNFMSEELCDALWEAVKYVLGDDKE